MPMQCALPRRPVRKAAARAADVMTTRTRGRRPANAPARDTEWIHKSCLPGRGRRGAPIPTPHERPRRRAPPAGTGARAPMRGAACRNAAVRERTTNHERTCGSAQEPPSGWRRIPRRVPSVERGACDRARSPVREAASECSRAHGRGQRTRNGMPTDEAGSRWNRRPTGPRPGWHGSCTSPSWVRWRSTASMWPRCPRASLLCW